MTDLSPAVQAVKDAVLALYSDEKVHKLGWQLDSPTVVAALRALADQVVPAEKSPELMRGPLTAQRLAQRQHTRAEILAIAAELEAATEPTFTPEEIEMIQAP